MIIYNNYIFYNIKTKILLKIYEHSHINMEKKKI